MPSHRFPDVWAAYAWSYEIKQVWTDGSAFDPDPDLLISGGTGVMGAVLDALDIQIAAQKCDIVDGGGSWFELAFLSQDGPKGWVGWRKRRLEVAICRFCDLLMKKGYIADAECDTARGCGRIWEAFE